MNPLFVHGLQSFPPSRFLAFLVLFLFHLGKGAWVGTAGRGGELVAVVAMVVAAGERGELVGPHSCAAVDTRAGAEGRAGSSLHCRAS